MAVATFTTTDPAIEHAHRERLKHLEVRAAQLGYATPPEVLTEIAQIRVALGEVTTEVAPLTEAQFNQSLFRSVLILSGEVRELRDWFKWLCVLVLVLFLLQPLWLRLLERL